MIAGSDTETGDEIVKDGKERSLEQERSGEPTIDGDDWGHYQGDSRHPLDLIEQIFQGDRRKFLLGFEGVLNIVIRDIEVDGEKILIQVCITCRRSEGRSDRGAALSGCGRHGGVGC